MAPVTARPAYCLMTCAMTKSGQPIPHGLGLQAESGFDRRNRAPIADQRHDTRNGCLVGAPAKERRARPRTKRLPTHLTLEARPGLAMPANVALAGLPSCGTVQI